MQKQDMIARHEEIDTFDHIQVKVRGTSLFSNKTRRVKTYPEGKEGNRLLNLTS